MFTGIVTDVGEIVSVEPTRAGAVCTACAIACRYDRAPIADGASIACNGVCLTVVATGVEGGRRPGSRSTPRPRRWRMTTVGTLARTARSSISSAR